MQVVGLTQSCCEKKWCENFSHHLFQRALFCVRSNYSILQIEYYQASLFFGTVLRYAGIPIFFNRITS